MTNLSCKNKGDNGFMNKNAPYRESRRPSPDRSLINDRNRKLNRIHVHEIGLNVVKDTKRDGLSDVEIITLIIFSIIVIAILLIIIFV
jgi:hypothetical protein